MKTALQGEALLLCRESKAFTHYQGPADVTRVTPSRVIPGWCGATGMCRLQASPGLVASEKLTANSLLPGENCEKSLRRQGWLCFCLLLFCFVFVLLCVLGAGWGRGWSTGGRQMEHGENCWRPAFPSPPPWHEHIGPIPTGTLQTCGPVSSEIRYEP